MDFEGDLYANVHLGDEWDDDLRGKLMGVLKDMGGVPVSVSNSMAGSQEIGTLFVEMDGSQIVVETETYVGISISGRKELIEKIVKIVRG